jgi:hypothetical protein
VAICAHLLARRPSTLTWNAHGQFTAYPHPSPLIDLLGGSLARGRPRRKGRRGSPSPSSFPMTLFASRLFRLCLRVDSPARCSGDLSRPSICTSLAGGIALPAALPVPRSTHQIHDRGTGTLDEPLGPEPHTGPIAHGRRPRQAKEGKAVHLIFHGRQFVPSPYDSPSCTGPAGIRCSRLSGTPGNAFFSRPDLIGRP